MALSWLPAKGQRNLCDWLLPFTLSHPVVQNTFIASAAAHLLAQRSNSKQSSQLRIEMLRVKAAGLKGIKQLVGDPSEATSLATVSAISGLMAVEVRHHWHSITESPTDKADGALRRERDSNRCAHQRNEEDTQRKGRIRGYPSRCC